LATFAQRVEFGEGWVGTTLGVERGLTWLNRFRRLTSRYERRADIYEAFLQLGCILIHWNLIRLKGFG
jgi:transposase